MRTFFSIMRYLSLVILLVVVVGNMQMNWNIPIWLGLIYPVVILISWLEYYFFQRKYRHKNGDFIGSLIMADIVTPLNWIWDTARSTRIWNIWYFRKPKRRNSAKRTLKEMIVTGIIRVFVLAIALMIIFVIICLLVGWFA